jgi:hypothetical protein
MRGMASRIIGMARIEAPTQIETTFMPLNGGF